MGEATDFWTRHRASKPAHEAELDRVRRERDEALAVIQKALAHLSGPVPAVDEWWAWAKEALSMLSTAPSVVLGEHDREVRATELEAAAVIAEGQILHGRYSPAPVEKCQDIAKLLRERAAAIRNGEHA